MKNENENITENMLDPETCNLQWETYGFENDENHETLQDLIEFLADNPNAYRDFKQLIDSFIYPC